MAFQRAIKYDAKLRMAIAGPSGSGKTYTALMIATALADGQPIALIDTERESASKYADQFAFDVSNLSSPYHPSRFVEAIHEAEEAGYAVLIVDSLSLAWNGPGGLLEIVEGITKRSQHKNSYIAWGEATPIQNKLIDALTSAKLHIIVTLRSKQDYAQEKDDRGRTVIKKLGMAPIQRDGLEYEFDVFADMTLENEMIVQKSRCSALAGQSISKPGADVARTLKTWLAGAPVPERPAAPVQQPRPLQSVPKEPAQPAGPAPINDGQKARIAQLSAQLKRNEPDMSSLDAASANQLIRSLQADLDAKKPAPSSEAAPATDEPPANAQQMTSIRKLCAALGREEPDPAQLTFAGASMLIREMSRSYNAMRGKSA